METETLTATNSEDTDEQAESEEETQEEECVDTFQKQISLNSQEIFLFRSLPYVQL